MQESMNLKYEPASVPLHISVKSGFGGRMLASMGMDMQQVQKTKQPLYRNVQRFRGGLVFKAHRCVYHITLGLRVMKKKKKP